MGKVSLEKLEHFLVVDNQLKILIRNLAPDNEHFYSEESRLEYEDKIYKSFKYIQAEMMAFIEDFNFPGHVREKIARMFVTYQSSLEKCFGDMRKMEKFYQVCFSNMSREFLDDVKKYCSGHLVIPNFSPLETATTITELLHFFHSYIINDAKILQAMPIIDSKKNTTVTTGVINLYGREGEMAKKIFDSIPQSIDCGQIDIVNLTISEKILIMIRDIAHALSIEIDLSQDPAQVNYFIPKLCDIPAINNLKGVTKIPEDTDMHAGTTGLFFTSHESLTDELLDFIGKVPSDDGYTAEESMKKNTEKGISL